MGEQALHNFGMTVEVPDSLLTHASLVMSKTAGDWGPVRTVATMQRDITSHRKDIIDTDRSASL